MADSEQRVDTRSLEQRLEEARKREKQGRSLPIGGKSTKMGMSYPFDFLRPGKKKAEEAAYDKLQNMREEDVEVLENRLKETRNYRSGGKVSASSRADGCAQRGKTRGKMV